MKRKTKFLWIVLYLIIAGFLSVFLVRQATSYLAVLGVTPAHPIVGTWKGQDGRLFRFYRDGSLRIRWPDEAGTILHYNYKLVHKEIRIVNPPKPSEYRRRVTQAILGVVLDLTIERLQVASLSEDALVILDPRSGDPVLFERTDDVELPEPP